MNMASVSRHGNFEFEPPIMVPEYSQHDRIGEVVAKASLLLQAPHPALADNIQIAFVARNLAVLIDSFAETPEAQLAAIEESLPGHTVTRIA